MKRLENLLIRWAIILGGWSLGDLILGKEPFSPLALGGSFILGVVFFIMSDRD